MLELRLDWEFGKIFGIVKFDETLRSLIKMLSGVQELKGDEIIISMPSIKKLISDLSTHNTFIILLKIHRDIDIQQELRQLSEDTSLKDIVLLEENEYRIFRSTNRDHLLKDIMKILEKFLSDEYFTIVF